MCNGETIDPESIVPVSTIYPGQNYGDSIYYSVVKPYKESKKYYNVIGDDEFITAIGSNKCFLFKWYPNISVDSWKSNASKLNTDNEGDKFKTSGKGTNVNNTVATIERAGLSIYTSSEMTSKIVKLFGEDAINSGFVLGVVDSNLQYVYDMSDQVTWYSTQGSLWGWDGVSYYTSWRGEKTSIPRYQILDDRGNVMLYEDLSYGVKWIEAKRRIAAAESQYIDATNSPYRTEKVIVENVENYYVTNKTVVVNPDMTGLDSVLDFRYPCYSTEGTNGTYTVSRSGICSDALTVHVLTNGYFCGNLSWKSGESGNKSIVVRYGIEDRFDDERPFEILVKSLNRKVGTRISQE